MYALIYDEFDLAKREKKVISVHKTREMAEKALKKRQRKLYRRVWECLLYPDRMGARPGSRRSYHYAQLF